MAKKKQFEQFINGEWRKIESSKFLLAGLPIREYKFKIYKPKKEVLIKKKKINSPLFRDCIELDKRYFQLCK